MDILMVIAPANFRDEEFLVPYEIFDRERFDVTVASKGVKAAKGKLGASVKVNIDISSAKAEDYDAVVFIGGSGTAQYFDDKIALSLANDAYAQKKVLAAICIAPSILANAGLLKGKDATSFPSEMTNLRNKGANYTNESVTIDGNIITANGPEAASMFGEAIVKALKNKQFILYS